MLKKPKSELYKMIGINFVLLCCLFVPFAWASHFRGGTISWQPTVNPNQVRWHDIFFYKQQTTNSYYNEKRTMQIGAWYYFEGVTKRLLKRAISSSILFVRSLVVRSQTQPQIGSRLYWGLSEMLDLKQKCLPLKTNKWFCYDTSQIDFFPVIYFD